MKSIILALLLAFPATAAELVQIDGERIVEARRIYPYDHGHVIVEIQATSGNWLKTRWNESRIKKYHQIKE